MAKRRMESMCATVAAHPEKFAARLARDPDASWYIGRLFLVGALTAQQRDAAAAWLEVTREYEAMLCAPRKPVALDMNRPPGGDPGFESEETARRYMRLKAAYLRRWNAVAQEGHDTLRAVTDAMRDREARLDLLRAGLNALVRG